MPARTSKIGLTKFLVRFEENSLKYIAEVKPIGIATNIAISEESTVPLINGKIPNEGLAPSGASLVLKKSNIDTSLKK